MKLPVRSAAAAPAVDLFAPAEHAPPVAATAEPTVRVIVDELVLDDRIQPREKMDPAKVAEYCELLREAAVDGRDLAAVFADPLVVYVDAAGIKRVAEGFHRTAAARLRAEKDGGSAGELLAVVRSGGLAEARLWAAGTNIHGLSRTAGDTRRVLLWFVDDAASHVTLTPEIMPRLSDAFRSRVQPGQTVPISDGLIADLCKVHQSTVTRLRARLRRERAGETHALHESGDGPTHALHESPPEKRIGRDGVERTVPKRLFREELAAEDLASVRRQEDADPGRRPAAQPQRVGPDGPTRDLRKLFDWRSAGAAWLKQNRKAKGGSDDKLRRRLAAAFREPLAIAAWGAAAGGGKAPAVRDQALRELVQGARRAR